MPEETLNSRDKTEDIPPPVSGGDDENSGPDSSGSDNGSPERLARLEAIVTNHNYVERGLAMAEILRDSLYRIEFASLDDYCQAKWHFSDAHAYRLVDAAHLAVEMSPIGELSKESHARALLRVAPEARVEKLKQAIELAKGAGRLLKANDILIVARLISHSELQPVKPQSLKDQLLELWEKASPSEQREFLASIGIQQDAPASVDEISAGFTCNSCSQEFEDAEEAVALYECGECGTVFSRDTSANNNHQCPECNKFGHKVSRLGCPECGEGELESTGEANS